MHLILCCGRKTPFPRDLKCTNLRHAFRLLSRRLKVIQPYKAICSTQSVWILYLLVRMHCRTKAHSYMVELELKGCCASETASPNTKQLHSVLLWAHLNHTGTLSMVRIPSSLLLRIIIITNIEYFYNLGPLVYKRISSC